MTCREPHRLGLLGYLCRLARLGKAREVAGTPRLTRTLLSVLLVFGTSSCVNETEISHYPSGQYQPGDAQVEPDGYADDLLEPWDMPAEEGGFDHGDLDLPEDPAGWDLADARDADGQSEGDGGDLPTVTSCGFGYEQMFASQKSSSIQQIEGSARGLAVRQEPGRLAALLRPGSIAMVEPPPPYTFRVPAAAAKSADEITLPGYEDDMPLFERALRWGEESRCFETPEGAVYLSREEAYDLYLRIAEETTGVAADTRPGIRTVVGLRGAYPGTFQWHGNTPDRFNDTLVLLWIDEQDEEQVLEFPAHTDVGAYNFGTNASSSLRPNRRYRYLDDWHRSYNALRINEWDYRVRDDTNHNGHWDSDRNGWLPPFTAEDYDRTGGGHNIHMASVDGPLGQARVQLWSAGCQVIPGMTNWTQFIVNAWTELSDPVNYFLIDVRDIPDSIWSPCTPDGSPRCPWPVDSLPFSQEGDTSTSGNDAFDRYNCSGADESGPEEVYVLTIDQSAWLVGSVDCEDPVVDVDIHLLDGADPNACLARDHWLFRHFVTPGRYFVVVDSFVESGEVLDGPYTLDLSLELE
ncbi:MAG: hypothetical protein JW797_17740 [Bradymonadales bacterium]|nr:hypothetical protein [Bradymonadales bacterium]